MINKIKDIIREISKNGNVYTSMYNKEFINRLYIELFDKIPAVDGLYTQKTLGLGAYKQENTSSKEKYINTTKTIENIVKELGNNCYKIKYQQIITYIWEEGTILIYSVYPDGESSDIVLFCPNENFLNILLDKCIFYNDDSIKKMEYITHSTMGFKTVGLDVKKQDTDINLNYNDDLPHDKISDIINSKESGIIILYGIPGSGKTSYIRSLIYNTNNTFIFLDSSCFNYINDSSFIDLLLNYRDSVFVLEDCETLLQERESGNTKLSGLLNLSDGILGDSLNLKFICTFNSNLTKIDKALLRKGRLKLKYEFCKLDSEKVIKLAKKLNKDITVPVPMSLCDVYNYDIDNGNIVKEKVKMGF